MPTITYPTSLPGPSSLDEVPPERRHTLGRPGPWHVREGGRERVYTEQATFVLTAQQAAAMRSWWAQTLTYGGAYFAASWPSSRGAGTPQHRRFTAPPQWVPLGGGVWRMTAAFEVRGTGAAPTDGV